MPATTETNAVHQHREESTSLGVLLYNGVEYHQIPRHPNNFVSRNGVVISFRILKQRDAHSGPNSVRGGKLKRYKQVNLTENGKQIGRKVHQLVLETFVGPRPDGMICRHLNDDGFDNRLENLAWGTPTENNGDCLRNRDKKGKGSPGEENCKAKLTEADVREIRRLVNLGEKNVMVAKQFSISTTTISRIALGKTWKHVN